MPPKKAAASFVSFRPSERLTSELQKRADEREMSTTAKQILTRVFEMLDMERLALRGLFSPKEMQVLVAAMRDRIGIAPFRLDLNIALEIKSDPTAERLQSRYSVDVAGIETRLRALGPGAAFALEDAIARFKRLPLSQSLEPDLSPSLDSLWRVGLVPPPEPRVWGTCTVRLSDARTVEFVMIEEPKFAETTPIDEVVDELARRVISNVRRSLDAGGDPYRDREAFGLIMQIARMTKTYSYQIIEIADGGVSVSAVAT